MSFPAHSAVGLHCVRSLRSTLKISEFWGPRPTTLHWARLTLEHTCGTSATRTCAIYAYKSSSSSTAAAPPPPEARDGPSGQDRPWPVELFIFGSYFFLNWSYFPM